MTVQLDEQVICPILIGRNEELAALYSLIDVTRSGQSHAALISGEAGIGKSRLVAEAKKSALAQDFLPLQGSCFQTDISYPYAPILDLLRTLFAKRVPIPVTANQELFVNELVQLLPDLALLLPQLVPYSPAHALEPVQQNER
jgi:predicted ATPase